MILKTEESFHKINQGFNYLNILKISLKKVSISMRKSLLSLSIPIVIEYSISENWVLAKNSKFWSIVILSDSFKGIMFKKCFIKS